MRETEVKRIIRTRWSDPERAANWQQSGLYQEFIEPSTRTAWKAALRSAAGAAARRTGRRALDLGTGPGTIAEFWAGLGFRTTGLDVSPAMLAAARQNAADRDLAITFVQGDAETPNLPRRSFDVVSSRFLLFTLMHPGYALRRWVELLRPDGALVLVGHDHGGQQDGQRRRRRRRPAQRDPRHLAALGQLPFKHHTSADLAVVMEALGLRDIRRIPMDAIVAARTASPERRFHESRPFILTGRT